MNDETKMESSLTSSQSTRSKPVSDTGSDTTIKRSLYSRLRDIHPIESLTNCYVGVFRSLFSHKAKIVIEETTCGVCFEGGAVRRKCCHQCYCNHCYSHKQACPGCAAPTKMEAMTGATFMIMEHSEHEECRKCLDPGIKRRCCANYYCDDCYYSEAACRSCGTEVSGSGLKDKGAEKSVNTTIIIGWALTFFLVLTISAGIALVTISEQQTPIGIFGYPCTGLFRTCDVPLCIEVGDSVGEGDGTMTPLYDWRYCRSETTKVSLQGWGCVYDHQLWRLTGRTGGYPYSDNKDNTDNKAAIASRALGYELCYDTFSGGAYIFEDQFENWDQSFDYDIEEMVGKNFADNVKVSALWQTVVNGWSTDFCGLPDVPGQINTRALTFKGTGQRLAQTIPLDVSSGGWIEADLLMSPIDIQFNIDHPWCQQANDGTVVLEYSNSDSVLYNPSLEGGWIVLNGEEGVFPAWAYRDTTYKKIQLEISGNASRSDTKFRFRQLDGFADAADAWAIDNVRILRYLSDDWHESETFKSAQETTEENIMNAACCYDTEWCEERMTIEEKKECKNYDIPGFEGPEYQLRTAEVFLICVAITALIKFFYISLMDWYIRKRYPFQDEIEWLAKADFIMEFVPVEFRPMPALLDIVGNVHLSARLVAQQANDLIDVEDEEDPDEIIRKENEAKEKKKRKREKKKRKLKLGYPKEQAEVDSSDEEDEEKKLKEGASKETEFTSDMDKLKRSNMSQLRMPFDHRIDKNWRLFFMILVSGIFFVMVIMMAAVSVEYTIKQPIVIFGSLENLVVVQASFFNFLAFILDGKEIFYVLKHVVPVKDEFIPMVTLDLSTEGSALYIGRHTIRLKDITEANTFPWYFSHALAITVIIGMCVL